MKIITLAADTPVRLGSGGNYATLVFANFPVTITPIDRFNSKHLAKIDNVLTGFTMGPLPFFDLIIESAYAQQIKILVSEHPLHFDFSTVDTYVERCHAGLQHVVNYELATAANTTINTFQIGHDETDLHLVVDKLEVSLNESSGLHVGFTSTAQAATAYSPTTLLANLRAGASVDTLANYYREQTTVGAQKTMSNFIRRFISIDDLEFVVPGAWVVPSNRLFMVKSNNADRTQYVAIFYHYEVATIE